MPTSNVEVAHLLRRAGFGGTAAEVAALTPLTRAQLIDRAMDTSANPAVVEPAELASGLEEWQKMDALRRWWFDRMITTPAPLVERMTLFWSNHFVSSFDKVYDARAMWDQVQLYRSMALGNFRTLCHQMALTVAMLEYLDNATNAAGSPNQNFARELMELMTLGPGNYTEADVDASARAWTGHGIDDSVQPRRYVFRPTWHDNGTKTFFGTTKNWDGPAIIDEILDNPAKRTIMARFICRKLWGWFAYAKPADAVINGLADVFVANNLEIAPVVRAIFEHTDFWSTSSRNGLVRAPVEFAVGLCRVIGLRVDDVQPSWWLSNMGQELFAPPNVAGWKQNEYWISTDAMGARADFLGYVTWRTTASDQLNLPFLRGVVGEGLPGPQRPPTAQVIGQTLDTFALYDVSDQTRSALTSWHTQQRASGDDWVERQHLMILTMLTPEFQLA